MLFLHPHVITWIIKLIVWIATLLMWAKPSVH